MSIVDANGLIEYVTYQYVMALLALSPVIYWTAKFDINLYKESSNSIYRVILIYSIYNTIKDIVIEEKSPTLVVANRYALSMIAATHPIESWLDDIAVYGIITTYYIVTEWRYIRSIPSSFVNIYHNRSRILRRCGGIITASLSDICAYLLPIQPARN